MNKAEVKGLTDGNWVFDRAIQLMDEQNSSNGETRTSDTENYRLRTLGILNVLRHELYPYSDTFEVGKDGKQIVCPELKSLEQPINLDDAIAQGILPYGLAAYLLLGENDALAAFFFQRYAELVYAIGCRKSAAWETIDL